MSVKVFFWIINVLLWCSCSWASVRALGSDKTQQVVCQDKVCKYENYYDITHENEGLHKNHPKRRTESHVAASAVINTKKFDVVHLVEELRTLGVQGPLDAIKCSKDELRIPDIPSDHPLISRLNPKTNRKTIILTAPGMCVCVCVCVCTCAEGAVTKCQWPGWVLHVRK